MSSHRTPTPSRRSWAGLGTAAATVLLATSLAACGSSDDKTTSTSAATTAATTGAATSTAAGTTSTAAQTGGTSSGGDGSAPPAADQNAIRDALQRGIASTQKAKTAQISLKIKIGPLTTTAEGPADLVNQRYLLDQTVDQGGKTVKIKGYGEKGKVYIKLGGTDQWQVTDNPVDTSDPLSQVRQLQKATISNVGGVETIDGTQCRRFSASVKIADAIGNAKAPAVKQLMEAAPKGATIPVSACIDGQGLTRSVDEDYEPGKVFGSVAASAPRTQISATITQYGKAKAPERPAGIDDATATPSPLGGTQ